MASEKPNHPYHIIDPSPFPILMTLAIFTLACGGLAFMHDVKIGGDEGIAAGPIGLGVGVAFILYVMYIWWKEVIREGHEDKAHTSHVQTGLRVGMALFILSEVMFFFGFFFSFFKSALAPVDVLEDGDYARPVEAGVFPPADIITFDPFDLPLMNTLILLLSGTTITWAHHALLHGDREGLKKGLLCTIGLGVFFSIMQAYEYSHAAFAFSQNNYSSNFFMATGFHGAHVIIGTLFLAVCYFRARNPKDLTEKGHLGFEFAAWYWHFVDVVWLFLFVAVYIWGR